MDKGVSKQNTIKDKADLRGGQKQTVDLPIQDYVSEMATALKLSSAGGPKAALQPANILAIQRTAGNRAATRFLANVVQRNPDPVDIHHNVTIIRQAHINNCWAAAVAMLVQYRDGPIASPHAHFEEPADQPLQLMATPESIARAAGFLVHFRRNTGIASHVSTYEQLASAWGLTLRHQDLVTVESWRGILQELGPFVAKLYMGEWDHMVVIQGMAGDGTPRNTFVEIADPARGFRTERFEDLPRRTSLLVM